MAGPTTRQGPRLEIPGGAAALPRLFALLEGAVIVRPDGEAFLVIRDGDGLECSQLDLAALSGSGGQIPEVERRASPGDELPVELAKPFGRLLQPRVERQH